MKRSHNLNISYLSKFLAAVLLFSVTAVTIGMITNSESDYSVAVSNTTDAHTPVIVIDSGHGGEDGGASSENGVTEKGINLEMAKLCKIFLLAQGFDVRLTRNDDRLLYDIYDDLDDYKGQKKIYDLKNRIRFAKEANADLFISLHMNKFFLKEYKGSQVYYSPNSTESEKYASNIQEVIKSFLQKDNQREIKKATSSIYVLNRIECPAVLVECGFLSNSEDLRKILTESYRVDLAVCIDTAVESFY